jgi:hypothetical protein
MVESARQISLSTLPFFQGKKLFLRLSKFTLNKQNTETANIYKSLHSLSNKEILFQLKKRPSFLDDLPPSFL